MRDIIIKFSNLMESKLASNDHKDGWDKCTYEYLLRRLIEEVRELIEAIKLRNYQNVSKEAADVANFAMMIADKSWFDVKRKDGNEAKQ